MEETPRSVFLIVYTSKTDRLEKHLTENKFRLDDTQMDSTSTERWRFSNFKTVLAKRLVCASKSRQTKSGWCCCFFLWPQQDSLDLIAKPTLGDARRRSFVCVWCARKPMRSFHLSPSFECNRVFVSLCCVMQSAVARCLIAWISPESVHEPKTHPLQVNSKRCLLLRLKKLHRVSRGIGNRSTSF